MAAAIQAEKNAPKIAIEMPQGTSGSQANCAPRGIIRARTSNTIDANRKSTSHEARLPRVGSTMAWGLGR